jgi:molybdate transport system permease protein
VSFFALPIIALLTRISPGELVSQLATSEVLSALTVSLAAVALALLLTIAFGTPVAYLLARGHDSGGLRALEVLFDLPLVLPPAVAGIALLATFGNGGLLGAPLEAAGLNVAFTRFAVVLALVFVSAPLYVRQAQAAFMACDESVLDAARTSGASPAINFIHIELPLALRGLLGGVALSGARALGEFGATIMFAGSIAGVTQTLTLAIYGSLYTNLNASFALATLLLALTAGLSAGARAIGTRNDRMAG